MLRKQQVLVIGIIFFGSIFLMISQLDTSPSGYSHNDTEDVKNLQEKLKFVEKQLEMNKRAMSEVRKSMEALLDSGNVHDIKQKEEIQHLIQEANKRDPVNSFKKPNYEAVNKYNTSGVCPALPYGVSPSDVNMINIYAKLPFDDSDGGVWKQGYPIETSDSEWQGKKLKVFVVPHSHNDPGWIKTVEKYFSDQTQHILNNVVDALSKDSNRRFIWAEMSYLSMWWKIATADRKVKMKTLVDNGQLEMVTAGWVMPDEANTHYFAMIDQMIEGNEWLSRNLGVVPKNGWAIDPFGHSSTMAYILKKMDFDNMLIQRVHYAIKKYLSKQQSLEFRWRQQWCPDHDSDIVCHLMPFYSYDVPHTCGPDPKICCQFDFARLPGSKYNCPWKVAPVAINSGNVAGRSAMLLDQYRKKSKLFKTNTLLVILGDDFRYSQAKETSDQFANYDKIFDYVNSHPELHAELRFGTLSEYFQAMKQEIGGKHKLPALTGDFFTYADREDHYWSGYYVSRPYHKMQDRVLEAHLRGAEILFSLALPLAKKSNTWSSFVTTLYPLLVEARQNLGLFQHHDGITGTAKDHVVDDYGNKLMKSVMDTKKIRCMQHYTEVLQPNPSEAEVIKCPTNPDSLEEIQVLSSHLLLSDVSSFKSDVIAFDFDEVYREQNQPPERIVLQVDSAGQEVTVVVYNSLAYDRTGVICFLVSSPYIAVTSTTDEEISSQTNPIWKDVTATDADKYEVLFLATVPATGLAVYKIKYAKVNPMNTFPRVRIYNVASGVRVDTHDIFEVYVKSSSESPIQLENDKIEATFSPTTGFLQEITDKSRKSTTKVAIEFVTYTSRSAKDKSGAYLFLPSGPAKPHVNADHRSTIRHVYGRISSEIHVVLPNLLHRVTVYQGNGQGVQPLGVHVHNDVDVRSGYDNKEIAMRIRSDVRSSDKFFTDLNGFQIQERTNYAKLPIQANFYPMPAMAFIQDENLRLSLFTGQPLGVSSLAEGQLEVIMDRRLMQDDNRGLGQGVKDNVKTPESFVILLEHWNKDGSEKSSSTLSYPSLAAHRMSWELLHPMRSMSSKITGNPISLRPQFAPLSGRSWPCDVHLLNLRSIQDQNKMEPTEYSALLLHRVGRECTMSSDECFHSNCGSSDAKQPSNFPVQSLYSVSDVGVTSLSLQKDSKKIDTGANLLIKPMEIEAFKVRLR